jgi:ankyrin repeat protein
METQILDLCKKGHINKLKKLIKNSPTDIFLLYGLFWACYKGHLNIITFIIPGLPKFDLNWGLTGACRSGRIDIVNFMIEKGADDWIWGLSCACFEGHLELIKLMISKGANNLEYSSKIAYENKHWNVVHFFIKLGVNHTPSGKSYIGYLFNLPKFDRSMCYLLEDILHQSLIFCIQKYL